MRKNMIAYHNYKNYGKTFYHNEYSSYQKKMYNGTVLFQTATMQALDC